MNKQDILDAWTRWMHRNDLAADLETVWIFALEQAEQRVLAPLTEQDLVDHATRVLLHGGLIYLHELAQDDEGAAREMRMFDDAASDFSFWWSTHNNETIAPFTYVKPGGAP